METKEKVKDFNQRFLTMRNRIPATSRPAEDVTIEFYTLALLVSMAMFVRRAAKPTLTETFDEAIKVGKDMPAIKTNPRVDTDSASSSCKKAESPSKTNTDGVLSSPNLFMKANLNSFQLVIEPAVSEKYQVEYFPSNV